MVLEACSTERMFSESEWKKLFIDETSLKFFHCQRWHYARYATSASYLRYAKKRKTASCHKKPLFVQNSCPCFRRQAPSNWINLHDVLAYIRCVKQPKHHFRLLSCVSNMALTSYGHYSRMACFFPTREDFNNACRWRVLKSWLNIYRNRHFHHRINLILPHPA